MGWSTGSYLADEIFLIPSWSVMIAELLILVVVIFGGISAVNKYKV